MFPQRIITRRELKGDESDPFPNEEWLVTNGLGGYTSGTVSGKLTRRYHGLLIAALPNPLGRSMMLNALSERIRLPNRELYFTGPKEIALQNTVAPDEFRLDGGMPVWTYRFSGVILEKRLFMPHRQNTVHVDYKLIQSPEPIRLTLRPCVNFRSHDASVSTKMAEKFVFTMRDELYEVCAENSPYPVLRILCQPYAPFTTERQMVREILYYTEETRGYESQGSMWSPGYFRIDLHPGETITFIASVETPEIIRAFKPQQALESETGRRITLLDQAHPAARENVRGELTLAADQFLIVPTGRTQDEARAHAAGEELRTVIAGYHWFTDWGRDTMISLEGLALVTGRFNEAGWILRTFSQYIRDGLIPNMFPEGHREGLYHTADATLWFFHALSRYFSYTHDRSTLKLILTKLIDIVDHHVRGTRFGIGMDPADGLLRQGADGYQLTWMDAKVGDWVVTPRRGKAVEINALWYNALCLMAQWVEEELGASKGKRFSELAARVRESFNQRFWIPERGYLFDVIDGPEGDDPACRPNQLFSVSLPNPVLDRARWEAVVDTAKRELLTPFGLRSLSPEHPDYKSRYDGDLRARDAAYHQGTVWGWLIGPFIDAWLKVYPDRRQEACGFLSGFNSHLSDAGVGSISEVFDADPPHIPRACIAQAWSVAEVLRCLVSLSDSGIPA